jgi:hypothetical protein
MAVRITQIPVETSIAPTDGKVRITQIATETSIAPTDGAVRITQIAIETSIAYIVATQLTFFDEDINYIMQPWMNSGVKQTLDEFVYIKPQQPRVWISS